jgi:hypothetical protein
MELTAVPATQFSSVQLTDILNACFELSGAGDPVGGGICSAL